MLGTIFYIYIHIGTLKNLVFAFDYATWKMLNIIHYGLKEIITFKSFLRLVKVGLDFTLLGKEFQVLDAK